MRIESIQIHNFRQYRDESISFPKTQGKKDIHIIVGENGEGKTNILNALTWCLYGEEFHLGDRNTAIYTINSSVVDELRSRGDDQGDMSVNVVISDSDSKIRFERRATYRISETDAVRIDETLTAYISGGARGGDIIESKEEVDMWISRYIPREIHEYIFFDGELLDRYFKEAQRSNIENGIKDLTQASILEKTIKGLDNYVRQELSPAIEKMGDDKVKEAEEKYKKAFEAYSQQYGKVKDIESNLSKLKEKIEELNSIIKGHENLRDKQLELERLDLEIDKLSASEKQANEDLIDFAQEYYTLFALYPALKQFYDRIKREEKDGKLPPKIDKELLQSIFDNKKCIICGTEKLGNENLEHVLSLLKKFDVSSDTSAELNQASSALQALFDKMKEYKKRKEQIQREILMIDTNLEKADNARKEIEAYLKTVPNTDSIRAAIEQRDSYRGQYEEDKEKLGREKLILEGFDADEKSAKEEKDKAIAKNGRLDSFRKKLEFCETSKQILSKIKDAILLECRNEMQQETFKIFDKLIWKKGAFSRVSILDDYEFQLFNPYGEQTLGSCSAAERALLALSFTIALQQTSGHDSLLYIDTPLGRVGDKNRGNFTDVLTDVAESKQVILSFTPTEYDANVRSRLEGKYSSFSQLAFENGITIIK